MTVVAVTDISDSRPLSYLPVGLFGSVMGIAGLSVAWRIAHLRYGVPEWISHWIGALAVIVFATVASGYIVKLYAAPDAVRAEFSHPIAGNLFGTPLIGMLLLPIILSPVNLVFARCLWAAGAAGMFALSWTVITRWMSNRQVASHATPAWLVPVVGLLNVPLAMPSLELTQWHGLMIVGLAVGMFFGAILFALVFSRLLFEPPLPEALQPSLMILLAPFAVGTSTYIATSGAVDLFAQALYALTVFILTVLIGRLRHLSSCCPFRVSWWAVSFPLAAAAVAALRVAQARPGYATDAIALLLLATASSIVTWLLARTAVGIAKGELRTLST